MLCTGVGRLARGIETFFSDAFAGLKNEPGLDVSLMIGSGVEEVKQEKLISLSRTGKIAPLLGRFVGRDGYVVEQLSSIPSVLMKIRRHRPQVVFSSEANLAMKLKSLRGLTGIPYRFIYSNGAPLRGPFPWADYVHQVTPTYHDFAIEDGDDPSRHILVPYGFRIPDTVPDRSIECRLAARRTLGLPERRPIVLSVGWIARQHKRMDYVANEISLLRKPRPVLAMVGAMDRNSTHIIEEAKQKLGETGVIARSVSPSEMPAWYAAADVFVLGSLVEGFGRVYIEALGAGVPVFCHDHAVGRFVNGDQAVYGDFSEAGGLAALLQQRIDLFEEDPTGDQRRWQYARQKFSWQSLAPRYREMFQTAVAGSQRH